MESNFKAQLDEQFSSFPYELALDERYIETFKQFINSLLYKNPDLLALIDKLILATDKEDKATIRLSIQHHLTNPHADHIYQKYWNWLSANNQHSNVLPTNMEHIQKTTKLFIREKVADVNILKSNDLIDQLKQRLRQRYQENIDIKRLFYPEHPLLLDDCYIHLGLTQKPELESAKQQDDKMYNDFDKRDLHLRGFERGIAIEKKLEVAEMAKIYLPKHQRILIEGPAGSGKTTLCRYIAYQWALGEQSREPWAQQYDWLFWIPLRELIALSNNSQADLVTILRQVCFRFNGTTNLLRKKENEELFLEHLASQPQRVLYLLDGYDELDLHHPNIQTLWDELQNNEQIILTTRPGRPVTFDPPFKLQLTVLGLSNEQIKNYTTSFFSQAPIQSPDMAKVCYEFIQTNTNLWSLAHIPINLEMLCSLWDQKALNNQTDINLTDLYQLIFQNLLVRYVKRLQLNVTCTPGSAKQHCQVNIAFMEYLAFLAMQQEVVFIQDYTLIDAALKQVSRDRTIDKNFLDEIQALGLLNFYQEGQQAEFAHLTFQEFFAARYIKKQLLKFVQSTPLNLEAFKQLLQFIQTKKHEPFYEVMWWFVAGLLAQKPEKPFLIDINPKQEVIENVSRNQLKLQALQLWVDCILQPPHHSKDELADACLLMRCLDEAKFPNIMQKPAIIALFRRWLDFYINDYEELNNILQEGVRFQIKKITNFQIEKIKKCLHHSGSLLYQQRNIRKYLQELIEDKKPEILDGFKWIGIWWNLQRAWPISVELTYEKSLPALLLQLVMSDNVKVKESAFRAVWVISRTATKEFQLALVPLLTSTNQNIQQAAISMVKALGNGAKNIELQQALISLIESSDSSIKREAVETVKAIGTSAQKTLQLALIPLLESEDQILREAAIDAVVAIGSAATPEFQLALLPLLVNSNIDVQDTAIKAIWIFGKVAIPEFQEKLIPLIEDADPRIKDIALSAIYAIGESTQKNLQLALLILLESTNVSLQKQALGAVKAIGRAACQELQQILIRLLASSDQIIKEIVIDAVREIRSGITQEFHESLVQLLKSKDQAIQLAAIRTVHAIGRAAKAAPHDLHQALIPLLKSKNYDVKLATIEAISAMGNGTPEDFQNANDKDIEMALVAFPEVLQLPLVQLLKKNNTNILNAAIGAIHGIRDAATREFQLALVPLLKNVVPNIQLAAVIAVSTLGEEVLEELQLALIPLLTSQDTKIQQKAIVAVEAIGKNTHLKLQLALIPLLASSNSYIQDAAIGVIWRFNKFASHKFQLELLQLLRNEDRNIQAAANKAMYAFAKAAAPEFQLALLPLLEGENQNFQQVAIEAVYVLSEVTLRELQLALIPLLRSTNHEIQKATLEAVSRIGKVAVKELQVELIPLLESENLDIQQAAVSATAAIGARLTNDFKSKLVKLLRSEKQSIVLAAIRATYALEKTISKELQLALVPLLSNQNLEIQQAAIWAVRVIGKLAMEELQLEIGQLLKNKNRDLQQLAISAVAAIGEAAHPNLLQALVSLLTFEDSDVQYKAVLLLCNAKSKAIAQSKSELLNLISNPNKVIARLAALCLSIIVNNVTHLKQPFEINTLQLLPSQIFDWTEEKIQQLVPLCGEIQKPILQSGEVQHVLTADYWTLALVRKKDRQHVFLVLEGVQDANHFAKKIALVLPNASGSSFINPNYAEIRIEDINDPEDYVRLKNLSENCECQIYSITAEIGNQLIGNAKADQEAKIYYNYSGDGQTYSFSFFNKERHNCLSWCLKQLQAVGIPLKRHWLDVVCVLPENYLPSTVQKKPSLRCAIS